MNLKGSHLSRREALTLMGAAGIVTAYPGRRSFASSDGVYDLAIERMGITVDG